MAIYIAERECHAHRGLNGATRLMQPHLPQQQILVATLLFVVAQRGGGGTGMRVMM